jgi:hypothetical protein
MNNLNDSNWLGRTPRTLDTSKWGTAAKLEGFDNDARPTWGWCVAGVLFAAALALFCFIGPVVFG